MEAKNILLILVPLLGAVVLDFAYRLYRRRRRFRDLPKPPHSFFWGHLKLMGEIASQYPPNCHPQIYITTIARKYGLKGIFYLDLWPVAEPQVVLIEPELMDAVQVQRVYNQHRIADEMLQTMIGRDVVAAANGPVWKKLHNAMAPALLPSHIRNLTGVMADQTMIFRDTLRRFAATGQVFSFEAEVSKLVFDIVGPLIFNFPLHAQTPGGSEYHRDLKQIISLVNQQLSMNPLAKLDVTLKRNAVKKRVDASVTAKIRERLAALRSENIVPSRREPLSILDLMLRETVLKDKGAKAKEIPPAEMELLVTNVKGLMVGAMGTTADVLCYLYMLLSKHPEVMQKMRDEHDRVFGKDLETTVEMVKESPMKLEELEYTTCVLKEAMRLFPVGFGVKEAPRGATVHYQGRDYPVDDGLTIVPCWHTMHFDARYFPEPSAFRPERFLGDAVPRGWFRTFSRGPRACLGQDLAMEDMRVIVLLTVRDFDFACAGLRPNPQPRADFMDLDTTFGDIVFPELAMEAKPRGGMMMTVKERNAS
ncbi:cytochrome P450 [Hypoxylon sp. FL1284]|nr:cytochrome P450 [Hypoxylon sp. FL1284]